MFGAFGWLRGQISSNKREVMRNEFQDILDSLVEKAPRSRLDPYSELIIEMRRRRRTYREIVNILSEKCDLRVSISTLYDFLKAKSRGPRKPARIVRAAPSSAVSRNPTSPLSSGTTPNVEDTSAAAEGVRRRVAALKQRRITNPADSVDGFQYDPNEPLRLSRDTKKS
jgi:hypothetical protein